MLSKIFKSTKKGSEVVAQLTGSAIRGTAKGLYKGVTGSTDEDILEQKRIMQLNGRIKRKAQLINSWASLILVAAICGLTMFFIGDSGFNGKTLVAMIKVKWPYYLAIGLVGSFVTTYSYQFAKETTV